VLRPSPRSPTPWWLDSLLFLLLATAVTWPLAARLGEAIPLGTEDVATVPYAMTFSFGWVADRAAHGLAGVWDAPIFWPTRGTFALSEPNLLGGLLTAPLTWVGGPGLGVGVFLLLSLALNGLVTLRVLQRLGLGALAAWAGGVGVLLLPAVHQELGVVPLVPLWGVIGTVALAGWCAEAPSARRGAAVGVALGCTYLLCAQYALFVAVVLGTAGLTLVRRPTGGLVAAALVAVLGFGLVAGPVVVAQRAVVAEEPGFVRSGPEVRALAAHPRTFARVPWRQVVPIPGVAREEAAGKAYHPGTGRLLLALLGLAWGLAVPGRRRTARFLGAAALASYAMAIAPWLTVGSTSLWDAVSAVVPGYAQVRALSRWAVFVQASVVLLAAFGVQAIVERVAGRAPDGDDGGLTPDPRGRWRLALWLAAGLCALEIVPARSELVTLPADERHAAWARWVRDETPEEAVLVFLPMPADGSVQAFADDAAAMLLFRSHERPTAGGYSSFFPRPFRALRQAAEGFPRGEVWEALHAHGVTHAVVPLEVVAALPARVEVAVGDPATGRAVVVVPEPPTPADPTPPPGSRPTP